MFMEFFIYLNVFIAGWLCCQFYLAWKLHKAFKKIAEENNLTMEELASTFFETRGINTQVIKVPNYFTEITSNSILLYSKDTGDFVSQANSIEQLAKNVYEFNKIKYASVNHNDNQFWFLEGKVLDENTIKNESQSRQV